MPSGEYTDRPGQVRRLVWTLLSAAGGVTASKHADTDLGEPVVVDVDATTVLPTRQPFSGNQST